MRASELRAAAVHLSTTFGSLGIAGLLQQLLQQLQPRQAPPQPNAQAIATLRANLGETFMRGGEANLAPGAMQAFVALGGTRVLGPEAAARLDRAFNDNALDSNAIRTQVQSIQQELQQIVTRAQAIVQQLAGVDLLDESPEIGDAEGILQLTFAGDVAVESLSDLKAQTEEWIQIFEHMAFLGEPFRSAPRFLAGERGSFLLWLAANKDAIQALSVATVAIFTSIERLATLARAVAPAAKAGASEHTLSSIRDDLKTMREKIAEDVSRALLESRLVALDQRAQTEARAHCRQAAEKMFRFVEQGGRIEVFDPKGVLAADQRAKLTQVVGEVSKLDEQRAQIAALMPKAAETDDSNATSDGEDAPPDA